MVGGALSGSLGVLAILALRRWTPLKEDTAMGCVLSVFFGAGMALWGIVQKQPAGHAAGLETFIYGKAASMILGDVLWIGVVAVLVVLGCVLLFKELKLLCFDDAFAGARGLPVLGLDLVLMGMVVAVCIVGLQAVGLILMIALLVIPAASARFWVTDLKAMVVVSTLFGGVCGWLGAISSGLFADLPSGAMIVLACSSMFFGQHAVRLFPRHYPAPVASTRIAPFNPAAAPVACRV